MLNSGLRDLGLLGENMQWLAQASTAFPMQILIGVLVSIPFTVDDFPRRPFFRAEDLYDAAASRGRGAGSSSALITLPLLRPFINIAFVLNTIYVFNSFPIIWATTQGGPANSTDILVTYLYKLGFRLGQARRGFGGVADHVRDPARLHADLRASDDARGGGVITARSSFVRCCSGRCLRPSSSSFCFPMR